MSLKSQTSLIVAAVAALVGAAAELQAVGAIRPEHDQKFANLRVSLDQLNDAAQEADKAAADATPESPDAAALDALRHTVETLALTVDGLHDEIAALRAAKV